jgi:hypothetical protein
VVARRNSTAPHWPNLTPEIQQSLFVLLIQMLQQNLPAPNAKDEREVTNESR